LVFVGAFNVSLFQNISKLASQYPKSGRVTIAYHLNDYLAPGTFNSILKQAKLKAVE